jgi:hypothetical protein
MGNIPSTHEQDPSSTLLSQLDTVMVNSPKNDDSRLGLFVNHQFYLVGFDNDISNEDDQGSEQQQQQRQRRQKRSMMKNKLCHLIRRGNGTIYWDINESITVLVVSPHINNKLYDACKIVSSYHMNMPSIVSPLWIIQSYMKNAIQPIYKYPPIIVRQQPKAPSARQLQRSSSLPTINKQQPLTATSADTTTNANVFRGCLFAFIRSGGNRDNDGEDGTKPKKKTKTTTNNSNHNSVILDFDPKEQATFIKHHGGQILSLNLVDALKMDSRRNKDTNGNTQQQQQQQPRRKCYVVCWGGYNADATSLTRLVDINPLTSQIKRYNLCELICVTPIWIQTCVTVQKRVRPECLPTILIPQSWPMRKSLQLLVTTPNGQQQQQQQQKQRKLDVSLTGFQGTEKAAIIHLIGAMGGMYHDHMSHTNTHLVCKETATGLKLQKAIEWKLHIVSVQWLYHILQYGYNGITSNDDDIEDLDSMKGCEGKFSLV